MGKSYKTSKHPNKIYILQKYTIKINILKLNSNKKYMVLLTWSRKSSIKLELEYECWQTKCLADWIYSKSLIWKNMREYAVCCREK